MTKIVGVLPNTQVIEFLLANKTTVCVCVCVCVCVRKTLPQQKKEREKTILLQKYLANHLNKTRFHR